MLYHVYAVTIKDLKILLKDRGGVVTLFLMPVMFILVMSVALRGAFEPGGSDSPVRLLVVNQDKGGLAAQAISDLESLKGMEVVQEVDGRPLSREVSGKPKYREKWAKALEAAGRLAVVLFTEEKLERLRGMLARWSRQRGWPAGRVLLASLEAMVSDCAGWEWRGLET